MKMRLGFALGLACVLSCALAMAGAQEPYGGGGQRGERGFGGMGMGGHNLMGTVTEVGSDHYTVKTFSGETYTVHFSANTRIMKEPARTRERGQGQGGGEQGGGYGRGMGMRNPPQIIKASDIKVGDYVAAMGDIDAQAKSVGATNIVLLDPERARQMEQMEANFGKTWLMGRVTAINGVQLTVTGSLDNAPHTIVADENTTFRKRREPVTLADIQVGDMVRAEGAMKNGAFTAATIDVMGVPGQTRMPRGGGGGGMDQQPQ